MVDENVPFACLTCYDATTARWLERAGVPILLVGDTAAEVILGFKRTLDMPLDVLIALTAAVKRGAPRALVALAFEALGELPEGLARGLLARELGAAARGALQRSPEKQREKHSEVAANGGHHSIASTDGEAAAAMVPSSGELALA